MTLINYLPAGLLRIKTDKIESYLLPISIFSLFAIVPLYYQPNLGGLGLHLAFNISIWAVAISILCVAILAITTRRYLRMARSYLFFVSVPAVIIVSSFVSGASQLVPFLFRELYLVFGLLFFFALFQLNSEKNKSEWTLLAIAISTLPHSIIGIVQIYNPGILGGQYATPGDGIPRSIFQQINVQATFLATGAAILI